MFSKTKLGAILIGLSLVLATIGGMLKGTINIATGITSLITEIGIVIVAMGIRDLPIINRITEQVEVVQE